MKLLWTTIQVADLDRSLAFYHDLLGLPLLERFPGAGNEIAMLGAEGAKLELLCKADGAPANPAPGLSMGFEPEDIQTLLKALAEKGIPVSPPRSPNPTMKFYFLQDPDGYAVQLVEYI